MKNKAVVDTLTSKFQTSQVHSCFFFFQSADNLFSYPYGLFSFFMSLTLFPGLFQVFLTPPILCSVLLPKAEYKAG